MTKTALNLIGKAMAHLGLEYSFGRCNKKPVPNTYWVGEYQESPTADESGHSTSTFMLTGHHRGDWADLETQKEKIENYFNKISGKTVMTEDGSAVAVFYSTSLIVPSMDAELKRMQINLDIHEWSVK